MYDNNVGIIERVKRGNLTMECVTTVNQIPGGVIMEKYYKNPIKPALTRMVKWDDGSIIYDAHVVIGKNVHAFGFSKSMEISSTR